MSREEGIETLTGADLLARYGDVLKGSGLPSIAQLERQVRSQFVGDARMEAIATLLLERYTGIYSLADTCWGAFVFESPTTAELDQFAHWIRQADALSIAVIVELRIAGFTITIE